MSLTSRVAGRRASVALPRTVVIVSAIGFTLASWAMIAVAWWPVYQATPFLLLAAVAIPLGCAIAVASALLRWPGWGVLLALVATMAVVGVPLAVPSRTVYGVLPDPSGLLELFAGVALGWRQLLTIDLPVGDYQALLVQALVLLLGGPVLTLVLALRIRHRELSVAVPALAYPLVLALGPERVDWPISTTLGMLVILLMWMAVWRQHRRTDQLAAGGDRGRRGAVRQVAIATALVLVAGGIGAATIALVPPTDDRTVLRSLVEQPFDPVSLPSPLAAYRASFAPEVASTTALTVQGLPVDGRIRIATLDSYDGVVFAVGSDSVDSASGRFVRIPTRRDAVLEGQETATVSIRLERAYGTWLPTVGEFIGIRILGPDGADLRDRFVYNDVTGTAAIVGGPPAPLDYELDVALPADNGAPDLRSRTPGDATVPALAAQPETLADWLVDATSGAEGDGARLDAALRALRTDGYVALATDLDAPFSRPGHSVERLDELLTSEPMIGDAEQYAALAAIIARELGFPSRVVLGFGPGAPDGNGGGAVTYLESDRTAWIEVSTAEGGWEALDVVPEIREIPPQDADDVTPVTRPQNAVQPPLEDVPPPDEQAPPEVEATDDEDPTGLSALALVLIRIGGILLAVLGLLALPAIIIVALKARRRRRRRRQADPATRILAGWTQVTDDATDYGIELPVAGTRRERAAAIGRPQALVLARVADRATYAPEEPDPVEADRVWAAVDGVRSGLAENRTRRQRMRAALSTRSLRRYPGRTSRRPGEGRA